jgi:hypothetical protein
MKLAIYQSYIKEPQKFFAPSSPCRLNFNLNPIKPIRRFSMNETPIVVQLTTSSNSPLVASQTAKMNEHKKSASNQLTKVELILEDIFHQQRTRSEKIKRDLQIFRRPNTSKTFYGKMMSRPLTVNTKYVKKGVVSRS